jgi:hypothetical protein
MHIFGYVVIGFLIVCMLLAATKALSVAQLRKPLAGPEGCQRRWSRWCAFGGKADIKRTSFNVRF